jgi:hypothetical protein
MKSTLVGTLSGISAAVVMMLLVKPPVAPAVKEIPVYGAGSYPELAARFLATTRPDEIAQRMNKIIPKVTFKNEELEKVLAWISQETGVNIYVEWHALMGGAAIGPDSPVSLNLQNVSTATTLQIALDQTRITGERAVFAPMDGVLKISMESRLDRYMTVRVYDVRDLIQDAVNGGNLPRRDDASPHDMFSSRNSAPSSKTAEHQAIENLRTILQKSVTNSVWPATTDIDYFAGRFVITSSRLNHQTIAAMLEALRARPESKISKP